MAAVDPLNTIAGRLATFEAEQRLPKRRASANKKKAQPVSVGWPHDAPTPDQLAHAGFYYKPTPDHQDSVTCFFCDKSLDSWDSEDNPAKEHLAHVPTCAWAINVCIEQRQMDAESREQDPLSKEMTEVRRATFKDLWPHEKKKGWKCKVKKMVEAGWSYNPLPEGDDCVTCFYCSVSLDGWEPKDDPLEEHRRRAPDCDFFNLVEKAKQTKPQTKAKRGRASTTSKASRGSIMSVGTVVEAPSFSLSDASLLAGEEDSVMTTASTASKATRGSKKSTRAKATSKAKSRSKQDTVEEIPEVEEEARDEPEPLKRSTRQRGGVRQSTQVEEASVVEVAAVEEVPKLVDEDEQPKRKAPQRKRVKNSTAQEEAPVVEKPKRGRKRMSSGAEKANEESIIMLDAAPTVKATKPPAKSTQRKVSKETSPEPVVIAEDAPVEQKDVNIAEAQAEEPVPERQSEPEPATKPKRTIKAKKPKTSVLKEVAPIEIAVDDDYEDEITRHESREEVSEHIQAPEPVQAPSPSPSAQSSDAENKPPSSRPSLRPSFEAAQSPVLGTATRVPLAPTTPSKSPSKRNVLSNLASAKPWREVDLEAIFLASPTSMQDQENANLQQVLEDLSSPERKMSVEEWVAHNAQKAEERLKQECERLVGIFESEGVRALQSVEAIHCDF